MNKRNNTIRGVLLLVAAALMFSSCAETPGPEEEVTDTRTISFGTPALTRSAIDNAGDMQKMCIRDRDMTKVECNGTHTA